MIEGTTALTLDIDWAPDWVVDRAAHLLVEHQVRATWFVTHASSAVERLRRHPHLFELGIHPNCLSGSSHGRTEDEVLRHILEVVPGAVAMRTHGLYQSTNFLTRAARDYGIRVDVSLYLPKVTGVAPFRMPFEGADIWRIPYFWEDDFEMAEDEPAWALSDPRLRGPGTKVFDFHPIHIALNTTRFETYRELKAELPLADWTPEFLEDKICDGPGPGTLYSELVVALAGGGMRISELVGSIVSEERRECGSR